MILFTILTPIRNVKKLLEAQCLPTAGQKKIQRIPETYSDAKSPRFVAD